MKLSHFQFNLPKELLAEFPAENRDESRLMVVNRATKTIEHNISTRLRQTFGNPKPYATGRAGYQNNFP